MEHLEGRKPHASSRDVYHRKRVCCVDECMGLNKMQKKVILAVKAKARAKYFLGTLKQLMIRHKNKYFDLSREVLETGWLSIDRIAVL